MTIKALYPNVRPTLNLDFAKTKALDPRVTFSRASTGTFVGSNGLIQSAAVNQARFDHNPLTGESLGLLVEEARTNSLWPSEPTTAASRNWAASPGNDWAVYDGTVSSASRNAINGLEVTISPTLDSNGFTGGSTTNWGGIGGGGNQAGGSTGSVSLFINPLTWTGNIWIGRLPQDGNTTFVVQNFQLFNNGIYTGPASNVKAIFSDGTYWLHNIAWTGLSTNTAAGQFLVLFTTTPGDNIKKFWAGGFQWEAGAFSTSYIPTVASTVTRAADVASMTGTNFSSWYNQSEGSFLLHENNSLGITLAKRFELIQNSSPNSNAIAFSVNYGNGTRISSRDSNTPGTIDRTLFNVWSLGGSHKYGYGLRLNDFVVASGTSIATTAAGTFPPNLDSLSFGAITIANTLMNNAGSFRLSRLTYYPVRLPDAQLQALTAT